MAVPGTHRTAPYCINKWALLGRKTKGATSFGLSFVLLLLFAVGFCVGFIVSFRGLSNEIDSRSPNVGNPIASFLKSHAKGIPALVVPNPVSNFLGFTILAFNEAE